MRKSNTKTLLFDKSDNLAFQISDFKDNCMFDNMQRLNYYTVILITNGSGKVRADFTEFSFEKNSLLLFSVYQPFMITEKEAIEGYVIRFHPAVFSVDDFQKTLSPELILFDNSYNSPSLKISEEEEIQFVQEINNVLKSFNEIPSENHKSTIIFLDKFLKNASAIAEELFQGNKPSFLNFKDQLLLQKIKDAIKYNFKTKHYAKDYAELLGVNALKLEEICNYYFHKPLTGLISEAIIIEAKKQLYSTSKSFRQIAMEIGFKSENNFIDLFESRIGITPQFFRETLTSKENIKRTLTSHSEIVL